ncbi:TPA: hypothetical protein N0F65_009646 [Lagenidium giganteum]|uniref:Uncharacterized protein n=1 Tax=Lagenidium giganteum TaxID=4803 RepID=A0AAV2YI44_9STRA|nr:TPA: hypothetical protein N0F65_009646 [Lagenidium giganteum]
MLACRHLVAFREHLWVLCRLPGPGQRWLLRRQPIGLSVGDPICAASSSHTRCWRTHDLVLSHSISFSLACFFVFTGFLSCLFARGFQNVCCVMCFQIPIFVGIVITSLFIHNSFYNGYADLARIASALFIIIQIIIIIDSSYNARDFLLDKMDEAERDDEARQGLLESQYESEPSVATGKTMWEAVYLGSVLILTALAVAGFVLMFKYYGGCDLNVAFITLTVMASVVLTVLSVTSWTDVGLLPSAAVTLYLAFLCYQALHANPDGTCSATPEGLTTATREKSVLANAALAAFTITWTSWRTSATTTNIFTLSPSSSELDHRSNALLDDSHAADAKDGKATAKQSEVSSTTASEAPTRPVVPEYQFHLLMVLSSFYMAMVLTNWGAADGMTTADDNLVTMWVKIVSQWVAMAIFLWTIVAPSVFPDRDFSTGM